MEVALDSTAVVSLLRTPRRERRAGKYATALDTYVERGSLHVGVDPNHAIIDEWKRTAGNEYVEQVVIKWNDLGGIVTVPKLGCLDSHVGRKLRALGFNGTIDKLLVKVALVLNGKVVVSDDSDFWDPSYPECKQSVGDCNARVATLLRERLHVGVYTLHMLMTALSK